MRGDSLRDLYAKVLALCGLALLAGTGALVDYWPVEEPLPKVPSNSIDLRASLPVPQDFDRGHVAVLMPRTVPRPSPAIRHEPATTTAQPALPEPLEVTTFSREIFRGATVDLVPPPLPELDVTPVAALVPPAPAVEVPIPAGPSLAVTIPPTTPTHDEDGFITGALKKTGAVATASIARTGDAIVRTGAVAGASIVDAFKGLAGAVKKVSPFVP